MTAMHTPFMLPTENNTGFRVDSARSLASSHRNLPIVIDVTAPPAGFTITAFLGHKEYAVPELYNGWGNSGATEQTPTSLPVSESLEARWTAFLTTVQAGSPLGRVKADRVTKQLRPHLSCRWPLAAAAEDWTVFLTWEDSDRYLELEVAPDGSASWYGRLLASGLSSGSEIAGEDLTAVYRWLQEPVP